MRASASVLLLLLAQPLLAAAPPARTRATPGFFLALDGGSGIALLGPDGRLRKRLDPAIAAAAVSPDGRLVACLEYSGADRVWRTLTIHPLAGADFLPAVAQTDLGRPEGDVTGRIFLPVWSADGRRVVVAKELAVRPGRWEYAHWAYDLAARKASRLTLPPAVLAWGWPGDGKRLLATVDGVRGTPARLAWVSAEGGGAPEFLTGEAQVAYFPRVSPDGRKVLFAAYPEPARGQPARLYVMDLATRRRVAVGEPGAASGHCWSPDGSRVAYCWRPRSDYRLDERGCETLLFTCDPSGRGRWVVTSRRHKASFAEFKVYDWCRGPSP